MQPIQLMPRVRPWFYLALPAAWLLGCGGTTPNPLTLNELKATIQTTAHGVPHITANDYASVGFGAGYVYARDAICEIAGRFVTVNAQRSLYFGPDAIAPEGLNNHPTNLQNDFFWQRVLNQKIVEKELALPPPLGPSPSTRALIQGYVAGYNKYLADTGVNQLPDPRCKGAAWVRPITEKDIYLRSMHWNLFRSSGNLIPQLVNAAPPRASAVAAPMQANQPSILQAFIADERSMTGSNMIALGANATDNGQGMLFANPHWYWEGPERWYEIQLTIPGKLNVYGVQTSGIPVIQTGFTDGVAWAGTSSFANRWTPYVLELVAQKPTHYRYDGQEIAMQAAPVSVQVLLPNGRIETRHHTFWETRFGPVLQDAQFVWDTRTAYAVRDVGFGFRWLSQQFELNHAQTVGDISEGGKKYMAIGWRNLAAADRQGDVFYGDRTAIPHVTDEKIALCVTSALGQTLLNNQRLVVLDGSRSACEWGSDSEAPVPGIFAAKRLPELHRRDYTSQSNDTHWTNNPRQLLEGYPLIMGAERTARSLRTRNGLLKIERRLNGSDGLPGHTFSLQQLKTVTLDNRVLSAELWKDAVVELCQTMPANSPVAAACPILSSWNGTEDLDSGGAVLWRRFFERLDQPSTLYSVPFSPEDPINTPRGLKTSDPRLLAALQAAVQDLTESGMPLSASYRNYQYVNKNGDHLPIHGGSAVPGQYNLISSAGWTPGLGYPNVDNGSSFLIWMQFTPQGPQGQSVLTYSQSPNPMSPYYKDQTRMFGNKQTKPILFTQAAITADPSVFVEQVCVRGINNAKCK